MLCYKDRSFCSQECANRDCSRNINDDVIADSIRWWGNNEGKVPIGIDDFKTDNCGYLPLDENNMIK